MDTPPAHRDGLPTFPSAVAAIPDLPMTFSAVSKVKTRTISWTRILGPALAAMLLPACLVAADASAFNVEVVSLTIGELAAGSAAEGGALPPSPTAITRPDPLHELATQSVAIAVDRRDAIERLRRIGAVTGSGSDRAWPSAPAHASLSLVPPPPIGRVATSLKVTSDWKTWASWGAAYSQRF